MKKCAHARERERVCVCLRERETKKERACVCEREIKREFVQTFDEYDIPQQNLKMSFLVQLPASLGVAHDPRRQGGNFSPSNALSKKSGKLGEHSLKSALYSFSIVNLVVS